MPVNRNALIRYRTIDKCLQNRRRKWTIEDLIAACNDALYEFEGISKGISLRTIRLDLNAMRSDKLGYNAPIIVKDNKYYTYEDDDYSIANIPLTHEDLNILNEVSLLLQQFKGFSHFHEVNEIVNKLEDKIYSEQHQLPPVIDFEKNELLTGIHWLDILYKAIINRTTLQFCYQSFKAREANDIIFFPYLLKEYRNRWFVLGKRRKDKQIATLALDRILEITVLPGVPFQYNHHFEPQEWFRDMIGVTRSPHDIPLHIQFWADHSQAPYIRTKPIHHSQQVIEQRKDGVIFSLDMIINFELECELMGYGEGLKILSPSTLLRRMKRKAKNLYECYHALHSIP